MKRNLMSRLTLLLIAFVLSAITSAKVTIRLSVWDGDVALRVIRDIVKEFEKEHPDIRVLLEPNSDYAAYHQKLLTMYAASVAPDVVMMDPLYFQALAKRKALLPLNEFASGPDGVDLETYYEPLRTAMSLNGELYVLPRDIATMGLVYYNKRLFKEAGIPEPDGSWTWDFKVRPELREKDFLWVMQQLTKKDRSGKTVQWGYSSDWPELFARSLYYSYGGNFADNDERPTKVIPEQDKLIKTYGFAGQLMNKERWIPTSSELTGQLMSTTQMLFVNQKIAMFQSGIWQVPNMRKYLIPDKEGFFEWDITLFPAYKDGTRKYPSGGSGYGIISHTKHPREAWLLTKFLSGPVGMKAMAEAGIAQPAIRDLAIQPGLWVPGPNTPKVQLYPYNRIVTDTAVPFAKFEPSADFWPELWSRVASKAELVFTNQASAKEALPVGITEAQNRLNDILSERDRPQFNWTLGLLVGVGIFGALLAYLYWPTKDARKLTAREKKEARSAYFFLAPWIFGMIVLTVGPIILSLLMSFMNWDIIQPAQVRGLENYTEAFTRDPIFWKSLRVTFIYTIVSVPLGLIFALLLALLLNQRVAGVPLFRACYYIPSVASLVASSLIWRRVFQAEGGLLNSFMYSRVGELLGLKQLAESLSTNGEPLNWLGNEATALPAMIIMSIWGVGGAMVILLAGLQSIPGHYYEAAVLDGANNWKKFKNVTIPLLSPTLFFCLITGVIGSFQVFTQSLVMTGGGPNDSTRFYMLHLFSNAFQSLRMGYASALAWILFVIVLIFTALQFRLSKYVYYEAEAK